MTDGIPRRPELMRRVVVDSCPYAVVGGGVLPRPLELDRHERLHEDGRRLISSWFARAWDQRGEEEAIFESFIFAWMSVNAWAACVTGQDQDREYMSRLKRDLELRQRFQDLLAANETFRSEVGAFMALLPIFKAQRLRREGLRSEIRMSRREIVQRYLDAGVTEFEPECAEWHLRQGEVIPADWPHFIAAVYRVRCNLFHGEKSAHSEMDRAIVHSAFNALTSFFRLSHIL